MCNKILLSVIFVLLFCFCNPLKKETPNKKYYSLEADISKVEKLTKAKFAKLKISKLRIAHNYEGKEFVYRKDLEFENDFYNQFQITPTSNITEQIIIWIDESNISKLVTNRVLGSDTNFILEGNINSLFIDLSNNQLHARMDIELYLTDYTKDNIVFKKLYSKKISLKEKSVELYVKTWNQALTEILVQFTRDIQKIEIEVKQE